MWFMSLLAASVGGVAPASPSVRAVAEVPPARPGDVAIMEELVAARASRSPAAYELFLKRHPGHFLARIAQAELRALLESRR